MYANLHAIHTQIQQNNCNSTKTHAKAIIFGVHPHIYLEGNYVGITKGKVGRYCWTSSTKFVQVVAMKTLLVIVFLTFSTFQVF